MAKAFRIRFPNIAETVAGVVMSMGLILLLEMPEGLSRGSNK
jgi:hypothetical protein